MARMRRANTWEISDSEGESGSQLASAMPVPASGDGAANVVASGTAEPSPAKRRRRRTEEQMEADNDTREERRRERARLREEKREEQRRRREAAERLRSYRPEACLRAFTVCVDPVLVQNEEIDLLLGTLNSMEWKSAVEEQHLTHSITWRRSLPEVLSQDELASVVQEEQVQMVLTFSEFLEMLTSIQKAQQAEILEEVTCGSLFKELSAYLSRNPEKVVTLAVVGLSSWDLWRQQRRDKVATSKWDMGMDELYKNVCVIFLESWQDLTDHVCAVTKALSKRPMKWLTEEPLLPFCVEGSWASGVRVGKDGSGLRQVWSRQVQQLNRVSRSVAVAVTTAFPSPQMLLQAYKDSHSERERKGLLADLPVKSGERERRVGPEISSRVYRLLTSHNPQLVLD